jgi:hypothetical protein
LQAKIAGSRASIRRAATKGRKGEILSEYHGYWRVYRGHRRRRAGRERPDGATRDGTRAARDSVHRTPRDMTVSGDVMRRLAHHVCLKGILAQRVCLARLLTPKSVRGVCFRRAHVDRRPTELIQCAMKTVFRHRRTAAPPCTEDKDLSTYNTNLNHPPLRCRTATMIEAEGRHYRLRYPTTPHAHEKQVEFNAAPNGSVDSKRCFHS